MAPVILVVDDDPDTCDLLSELLSEEGYAVVCRNTGDEAVVDIELGTITPDLMLVDVLMPGLSARTILAMVRRIPRLEHIPIVLLSAADTAMLNRMGLDGEHLIHKPFELTALLELVHELMNRG